MISAETRADMPLVDAYRALIQALADAGRTVAQVSAHVQRGPEAMDEAASLIAFLRDEADRVEHATGDSLVADHLRARAQAEEDKLLAAMTAGEGETS